MRYLLVVIFLIIAFYVLREPPQKGSSSPTNDSFKTSFEEGLPSDYIPSETAQYSDLQKLRDDQEYRWTKLHRHFEEEKSALRGSKDYSKGKMEQLTQQQENAKEEFKKSFNIKKAELEQRIKEEQSSRDKGLR